MLSERWQAPQHGKLVLGKHAQINKEAQRAALLRSTVAPQGVSANRNSASHRAYDMLKRQVGRRRCFGRRSLPKELPSTATAPTVKTRVRLQVGRRRCFGRRSLPKELPSTATAPTVKTRVRLLDRQSLSSTETARPYGINAYGMNETRGRPEQCQLRGGRGNGAQRCAANSVGRPRPPPCARARRAGPPQRGHHGVACTRGGPTMAY